MNFFLYFVLSIRILISVSRLEEREAELKKEYNALHQRHTEVRFQIILTVLVVLQQKWTLESMS